MYSRTVPRSRSIISASYFPSRVSPSLAVSLVPFVITRRCFVVSRFFVPLVLCRLPFHAFLIRLYRHENGIFFNSILHPVPQCPFILQFANARTAPGLRCHLSLLCSSRAPIADHLISWLRFFESPLSFMIYPKFHCCNNFC